MLTLLTLLLLFLDFKKALGAGGLPIGLKSKL